jgi:hypothetical protein
MPVKERCKGCKIDSLICNLMHFHIRFMDSKTFSDNLCSFAQFEWFPQNCGNLIFCIILKGISHENFLRLFL